MEKPDKGNRRSSILKVRQMDIVPDNLEFDDDTKYVRRRRVSFHNVKTVQNYDKDNFDLLDGSPFREKIHETMSSDGVLTPGRSHTRMSISSVSTTTPCPTPVNKISDDGDDTMLLLYGFSDTINGKSMQFEDINATRNICVDMSVCDTNITEASCIENEDNTIVLFDRAGKVSDENIVANHINSIASESTMNIFRGNFAAGDEICSSMDISISQKMMEFNVSQDSKSRMVCTLDSSKEQKNSDDTMMKLFGTPNKTLQLSEDITKHEDILEESCIEMNSIAHNDTSPLHSDDLAPFPRLSVTNNSHSFKSAESQCDGASTDFICKSAMISTNPSNVCTKLDGRPVQNATILLSSDDVDMSDTEEKNGATINLSTEDINMSVTPPFELKICNHSPQPLLKRENSASLHSLLEETTSFIRMTMFEEQSLQVNYLTNVNGQSIVNKIRQHWCKQMDGRITSMKDNSIRQLDPLLLSLTLSDSIRAHAVKTLCIRNLNAEDSDLLLASKYQAETEWFAIRRDIAVDARIEVDDAVSKDETEVNILHDQMVMCQNLVQLKKVVSDLEQEYLSISMIDTTKISDIITEHDKEMTTSEQLEATILQLELKELELNTKLAQRRNVQLKVEHAFFEEEIRRMQTNTARILRLLDESERIY